MKFSGKAFLCGLVFLAATLLLAFDSPAWGAVAIDPFNPSIVYATSSSGVIKSTDGGTTWRQLGCCAGGITAIAIDPQHPQNIYVASYSGIYKSTDGGERPDGEEAPWSLTTSTYPPETADTLTIDPVVPTTLYGKSGPFVRKSTDSGRTWTTINSGLPALDFPPGTAPVVVDPLNHNTLYTALTVCAGSCDARVYKSVDAGNSWVAVSPSLQAGGCCASVNDLAINPVVTSTLYAGTADIEGAGGGVFKSIDGGMSWQLLDSGLGGVSIVKLDPQFPNVVYGVEDWGNNPLVKSADGGLQWEAVGAGLPFSYRDQVYIRSVAVASRDSLTLYADAFDSSTSSWKVFRSTDGGANFALVFPSGSNLMPAINSISPSSAIAGSAGFNLTVSGSNFVGASVVRWNGQDRPTTLQNGLLVASIPASDIAGVGTAQVTVFTPGPGGGTSDVRIFNITTVPRASITNISPATVQAGGSAFTLTVNGSGFLPGGVSVLTWNGSPRSTTVLTGAILQASITASDIAAPGTAQVAVFNTGVGGGASAPVPLTISLTPPPVAYNDGTVNGASFAPRAAIAAGSIASVFGANLIGSSSESLTVKLNNIKVPIFAVSPGQINFQVPWELAGQSQASLTVTTNGLTSSPVTVSLAPLAPGIFSTSATGSGQGSVLIANTAFIAAPVGALPGSRPVARGDSISIYCTGLGPVTNQPPMGLVASGSPQSVTVTTPLVKIGGITVPAAFSGLAPGIVGLYQVNVQVPTAVAPGSEVPVSLLMGDSISNTVTIAVQ